MSPNPSLPPAEYRVHYFYPLHEVHKYSYMSHQYNIECHLLYLLLSKCSSPLCNYNRKSRLVQNLNIRILVPIQHEIEYLHSHKWYTAQYRSSMVLSFPFHMYQYIYYILQSSIDYFHHIE